MKELLLHACWLLMKVLPWRAVEALAFWLGRHSKFFVGVQR